MRAHPTSVSCFLDQGHYNVTLKLITIFPRTRNKGQVSLRGWLVKENDAGIAHKGDSNWQTTSHATAEIFHQTLFKIFQPHLYTVIYTY